MSLVQVTKSALTVGGTTQTTSAIGTSAGNVLAFFVVYNSSAAGVVTPSDSTSLTWVQAFTYAGAATGLQLTCWIAKNITGNAANTFTLATTGSDTPTIFVAEFSGRNKNAPFDIAIGADDTTTTSGAHTTGTFTPGARNDDVIAFTVSSTLSQTYTASGAWVIPANGSVSNATGYDAFVQTQNNLTASSVANTYSVALADKLDAIIVGLQVPQQPYSDEWLDYFQEVPEVYPTWTSVQQLSILPQFYGDVDNDWNNEFDDNDAWVQLESASAVVLPSVTTAATQQYYGEDAELYDEALETQQFSSTYQQQTNLGVAAIEDAFDWFIEVFEDNTPEYETAPVVPDVSAPNSFAYDPDLDFWDDGAPDFFADDFGNDDADLPQADAWFDWTTDEWDDWATVDDNYANNTSITATPNSIEDAWDYGQQEEDEYPVSDDWLGADNNPALNAEDPTWWDEEPDQPDGTTTDLDAVGADNNPVICIEDAWDHFPTDDDDYFIVDEYTLVDVVPVMFIAAEDPWDHALTDDDEYFIVDEYALVDVSPNGLLTPEDGWDHFVTDDDGYDINDDQLSANGGSVSLQYPVDDAWDWSITDDDDYAVIDDYASLNNTPLGPDDAWDHGPTDGDDETWQALDTDAVTVPPDQAQDDPWDHFITDPDDEAYFSLDTDGVSQTTPYYAPSDGWDHFPTDDDDYVVTDDYASVSVIVAPAMPPEDAWTFAETDVEDNDFDFAVVDNNQLLRNVYPDDPAFEVYMRWRPFTVVWLSKLET